MIPSEPYCAPDREHLWWPGYRKLCLQPPALPRGRGLPSWPPSSQGDGAVGVTGGNLDTPTLRVAAGATGACVRAQIPQRLGATPGRAAGGSLGSGGAGGSL